MDDILMLIDERILSILRDKLDDSQARIDELVRLKEQIVNKAIVLYK